jgi:hypothetical protein
MPKSLRDPCRWASCSLTTDPAMLKKLKGMPHGYAARLRIPAGTGMSKSGGIHVDFWRFANIDLSAYVEETVDV